MNRSCKERETINRTTKIEPLEYTGLISQNAYKKSKSRERRRSTVIEKVKEISGLDTFDKALNGKLFFIAVDRVIPGHSSGQSDFNSDAHWLDDASKRVIPFAFLVFNLIFWLTLSFQKSAGYQLLEEGYKQFD